ncbi:MAG: hypothetical protein M0008_05720, partial [Actinomycetota bacterium]|nr:hypothetical protein [Actinomycetota bacterium]
DFRSGAERHQITSRSAEVNGRPLGEDLVGRCAAQLGLAGGMSVVGPYSYGAALGGMVKACLNRTRLLHDLATQDPIRSLAVLSAHRPIQGRELEDAAELGWRGINLESDAALSSAREVFALSATADFEASYTGDDPPSGQTPEGLSPEEYQRRTAWSVHRWDTPQEIVVLAAPAAAPLRRRANTADQLKFWADKCKIDSDTRILLVTTEHYVPYQQLQALLTLGRWLGCRITTTGTAWSPAGRYRAAGYLQEIRSTLIVAKELRDSLW